MNDSVIFLVVGRPAKKSPGIIVIVMDHMPYLVPELKHLPSRKSTNVLTLIKGPIV
jgi:hypothetical protein